MSWNCRTTVRRHKREIGSIYKYGASPFQQLVFHQTSSAMDLREEVQKLLDEAPNLLLLLSRRPSSKPVKGGSEEQEKGRVCG